MRIRNPNRNLNKIKSKISKDKCKNYKSRLWCDKNEMFVTVGICLSRKLSYFKYRSVKCKKCRKIDDILLRILEESTQCLKK